ncbi:hypothetical protein FKM82_028946, partial [Ascaphus truei]
CKESPPSSRSPFLLHPRHRPGDPEQTLLRAAAAAHALLPEQTGPGPVHPPVRAGRRAAGLCEDPEQLYHGAASLYEEVFSATAAGPARRGRDPGKGSTTQRRGSRGQQEPRVGGAACR